MFNIELISISTSLLLEEKPNRCPEFPFWCKCYGVNRQSGAFDMSTDYGSWNGWGQPPFNSQMNWQPTQMNLPQSEMGNFNEANYKNSSQTNLRYPAVQQNYSSQEQSYSHPYRYVPHQRFDSWDYRSRYEYSPVRTTGLHHNRWDVRDDNLVHNRNTSSRSDDSKHRSLSGSNETLNLAPIKEKNKKHSNRNCSVNRTSEGIKDICDRKDSNKADAHYFERRTQNEQSGERSRSKRRLDKRDNRGTSSSRKSPSMQSKTVSSTTSSRNIEKNKSKCHKNTTNNTDSLNKATNLSETTKSVKTTENTLNKTILVVSGGDTCSDTARELEDLINSTSPSKLQPKAKKTNTDSSESTVDIINLGDSNDSLGLTLNDVIIVHPEIPTVDLSDNSVEDYSLFASPETPPPSIKVESDTDERDKTSTISEVDKPTSNPCPELDGEFQPVNTRLSYLNCFTSIFDDNRSVNMDISPVESPLNATETTNKKNCQSNGVNISKKLSFSNQTDDYIRDDCEHVVQSATGYLCDIELPASNRIQNENETRPLTREIEYLIPHVKRNLSRSKSLTDLLQDDASVARFKSLRDLSTVKVDSNLLVTRIRKGENSVSVPVPANRKVQDDVSVVSNDYKEELYWLLCVSAQCAVRNQEITVKEETSASAQNNSSPDNSNVANDNPDSTLNICSFDEGTQEAKFNDADVSKVMSSDNKTSEDSAIQTVKRKNLDMAKNLSNESRKSDHQPYNNNDSNIIDPIKIRKLISQRNSTKQCEFLLRKKRRRIIQFDSSDEDESDVNVILNREVLKNQVKEKREEASRPEVTEKEDKIKPQIHIVPKPVTTCHPVIKFTVKEEELKRRKKLPHEVLNSKFSPKVASRRSSYSCDSKHATNKNVDNIRERMIKLFGTISDDDDSLTDTGFNTEEENTQNRSSNNRSKHLHSKKRDEALSKRALSTEASRSSSCKIRCNLGKVKTNSKDFSKKEIRKSVDCLDTVRSKSGLTSKERVIGKVLDNVKSFTKDGSSKRSSMSHKKNRSKHRGLDVQPFSVKNTAQREPVSANKQTTKKTESIRKKLKNSSKLKENLSRSVSKNASSKQRQSSPDISNVNSGLSFIICQASEQELGDLELKSCDVFDVAINEIFQIIPKVVDDACTDRVVVIGSPKIKDECETVKQVEMSDEDDDVLVIDADVPCIDLTEQNGPTKVTGSWPTEDLKSLLRDSKNNGATITMYRADVGDPNSEVEEVSASISLQCYGNDVNEPHTDAKTDLHKDLQSNTNLVITNHVRSFAKTNLPGRPISSEANPSMQPASITTQVCSPNNLLLTTNQQNLLTVRQPSINMTASQQSTSFRSATSLQNPPIEMQPPPLYYNSFDSMSNRNENFTSSNFITNVSTEELGISDRMKIVEILTAHAYFLAQLCKVQKMYVNSLSQCRYYKSYFQTEMSFFENQRIERLKLQSLRLYHELIDLKIKATRNLNGSVKLIIENVTLSLESKDMPMQVNKSRVLLLLWELLKYKIECYRELPLLNMLVHYCNRVFNKIISKNSRAPSSEQQQASSQSLYINSNVNPSIQSSVSSSVSSNTVAQHYQLSVPNIQSQSRPTPIISTIPSKESFAAPRPLAFRHLSVPEFVNKQQPQSALNVPNAIPTLRNAHMPTPNQIPLNLNIPSLARSNSLGSRNTFQSQLARADLTRHSPTTTCSSHNSPVTTTHSSGGSHSPNFSSLSKGNVTDGHVDSSSAAITSQNVNDYPASKLLAELLRAGKRNSASSSAVKNNWLVNLPFTKPQLCVSNSPSVSSNTNNPSLRINIIRNQVIPSSQNNTDNTPSSELLTHLTGQTSVQNETIHNQISCEGLASRPEATKRKSASPNYLHQAKKSKVVSDSQNRNFNNKQTTKGSVSSTTCSHHEQNSAASSGQSAPMFKSITPTSSIESNVIDSAEEQADIDIIDLTWIDDINETDLQNDMDFVFVKQENLENDGTSTVAQPNRTVGSSPADSGVESPGIQNEEEPTLTYVSRLCPCGVTASYTCACGDAWYCGQACQVDDWTSHQKICHGVNQTAAN